MNQPNMHIYPLPLGLPFLHLKGVSCRQLVDGSSFFIHSTTPCLCVGFCTVAEATTCPSFEGAASCRRICHSAQLPIVCLTFVLVKQPTVLKKKKKKKKNTFNFVLEYSQLTILWSFQVDSKGTQPNMYMCPFSPKLPSHPGCHLTLNRGPCAI